MKEINYKDMKFNPFNLIGDEWMLVTAGDEASCNTMTASWGHLGCLWGHSRCNFKSACRWGNWYFRNFHIQHRLHTDKV